MSNYTALTSDCHLSIFHHHHLPHTDCVVITTCGHDDAAWVIYIVMEGYGIDPRLVSSHKTLPYHASRQAFEYTSASRGQHVHHSLPLFKTVSAAARLPSLNLPPKHPAMSLSIAKKTRKSLTLEVKLDIIHRHERGEKNNSIARHHLDSIYCLYYFQKPIRGSQCYHSL
ncbi:hypothetical protein E2C01_010065 [Portunus trituberculatus]|uniref:HTH psq-type domain-containing protein n=1 Tax=Portunus trituberculatus TaxID=210409 RepID=A0A5B7D7N0_PORTR|nr:hypothetical protein [Portunus trituberculatus]